MQRTKAPKTVMKYLESVKKLGTYLMIEEEEAFLLGITQAKLEKTERLASALIKGLRPLAKKREQTIKAQIRDKMIDAADVAAFCEMLRKETAPLITRLSKGEHILWSELLLVRNYLIIELLVAGAPRSGMITGFTLGQFRLATNCKVTKDDGSVYWVTNVDDHKTATSHGPARLVFRQEVYKFATVYEEYGRVQTPNTNPGDILENEAPFFLEGKGKQMTRVAQTVLRLWKSHGFKGDLNLTHLRYTAATKACETLNPVSKRGIATLMAHTVATQEHYYNAVQASNAAVDASVLLRQSICQNTPSNQETAEGKDSDEDEVPAAAELRVEKRRGRIFPDHVVDYLRKRLREKVNESKLKRKGKVTVKDIVRTVYNEGQDVLSAFTLQSVYDKVRHSHLMDFGSDEE